MKKIFEEIKKTVDKNIEKYGELSEKEINEEIQARRETRRKKLFEWTYAFMESTFNLQFIDFVSLDQVSIQLQSYQ